MWGDRYVSRSLGVLIEPVAEFGGFVTDRDGWSTPDGMQRARIEDGLVRALAGYRELRSETSRNLLLDIVGRHGGPAQLGDYPTSHQWFLALVTSCAERSCISVLVDAAGRVHPETRHVLERYREEWLLLDRQRDERDAADVAATAPGDLWAVLRSEFEKAPASAVAEMFRRVTGSRALAPPRHCVTAWDVLLVLACRNTPPAGLPPYMLFLLHCGAVLTPATTQRVDNWNRARAYEMGMTGLLDAARLRPADLTGTSGSGEIHLMLQIDPDETEERYQLSWWVEGDGRSQPGGRRSVPWSDLEQQVDSTVAAVESDLPPEAPLVVLEFILPLALLNQPVEWWSCELGSGMPKPLAMDHAVVVRSLERMRNRRWHPRWNRRWRYLQNGAGPARSLWIQPAGESRHHLSRLEATLAADESLVALVLSEPPRAAGSIGRAEAAVAIRQGVPIMLWHRSRHRGADLDDALSPVITGTDLLGIPGRLRHLRLGALSDDVAMDPQAQLGRHLSLMWDDPQRQPASGSPGPLGSGRGEIRP